jgi:hypothetical protein
MSMKKTMKARWVLSLLGVATAAFVSGAALASAQRPPRAEDEKAPVAPSTSPAKAAGETTVTIGSVAVSVDPKTGEMRPLSRAEAARLAREMRKLFKPRKLERVENADGSLSAVVAPNVLRYSVARVGPDGKVSRTCVEGDKAALGFLSGAPSKPTTPSEER